MVKARDQRPLRADAQRSANALVKAARELFASKGVDVTTREIADYAGVGMGTLFRRFPRRADLIGAVFEEDLNACAAAAPALAADLTPFEALASWMQRYVDLIATKRGLAAAIASDDPVYLGIAERFDLVLQPAVQMLFDAATAAGEIPEDTDHAEIFSAVSTLCMSSYDNQPAHAGRMVALLMAGLASARSTSVATSQRGGHSA